MRAQGCDSGVLACTELSVFAVRRQLPPFYTDAMSVLAERAVDLGIPGVAFVPLERYVWDAGNAPADGWARFVVPYDALDAAVVARFADLSLC